MLKVWLPYSVMIYIFVMVLLSMMRTYQTQDKLRVWMTTNRSFGALVVEGVVISMLEACCSAVSFMSSTFTIFVNVFIVFTPPHRCYVAQIDENRTLYDELPPVPANLSNDSVDQSAIDLSRYIPIEEGSDGKLQWSQCRRYQEEINRNLTTDHRTVMPCDKGWAYYVPPGVVSATMEFNLVCDRAWLAPLSSSIQLMGVILGCIGGGYVSDKFGRKFTFIFSWILMMVCLFLAAINPFWILTYIFFFFLGVALISRLVVCVIIVNEMCPVKHRYAASFLNMAMGALGYMILSLFNYLLPNWRHVAFLYSAILLVGSFAIYFFVDESLTWLFQNSKQDEAVKLLKKIRKVNKIKCENESELESSFQTENCDEKNDTNHKEKFSYIHLIKISFLRKRILISSLAWLASCLSYISLSFNTNNLGTNRYIACALSGAMEVPGSFFGYTGMKKLGGRNSFALITLISTLCLLGTPLFLNSNEILVTVLNMMGKAFVTGAFTSLYVFVGDFFPTLLRNQSYGATSVVGRISTVAAPFLLFVGKIYHQSIPYLVMGTVSLLAAVGMFFLPETKNKPLPDTLEDAKNQEEFTTLNCCAKRKNNSSMNDKGTE